MSSTTWYKDNKTVGLKEHSINFGEISGKNIVGANTWNDWHLIPTSRPAIAHPPFTTKYVEIPGSDGYLDLSDYLTGYPVYGARTGSLQFYVDNEHENWEVIRGKIVRMLHGKKLKMQLTDDPKYYYEGRFTVGNWESGQQRSAITISYQLKPFKYTIDRYGIDDFIWDTFNFETDYDYYAYCHNVIVSGSISFTIYGAMGSVTPNVQCLTGSVTASFGGVTETVSAGNTVELGNSHGADTLMTVTGNGTINIWWGGAEL